MVHGVSGKEEITVRVSCCVVCVVVAVIYFPMFVCIYSEYIYKIFAGYETFFPSMDNILSPFTHLSLRNYHQRVSSAHLRTKPRSYALSLRLHNRSRHRAWNLGKWRATSRWTAEAGRWFWRDDPRPPPAITPATTRECRGWTSTRVGANTRGALATHEGSSGWVRISGKVLVVRATFDGHCRGHGAKERNLYN